MIRKNWKISSALLIAVCIIFSILLTSVVIALTPQEESILTVYVLFKANAKSEFTNNIDDKAVFKSLYRGFVDKIKEKRSEYFQTRISLQQVTTVTGPKNIDINIPDVYDFILAKAQQFSDDALVEEYKRYVGPPKYATDVKEFKLTVKVLVPGAFDTLLSQSGAGLRVSARHASDRGNTLVPFARREVVGSDVNYDYEKTIKFDSAIEEDVIIAIDNMYDWGYGLVDSTNVPIERLTKRFNRGTGPQEVVLTLKQRDKPTKTLRINFKYETEKGKTASLSRLGYSLSQLPPITILSKDSAAGTWQTVATKLGNTIELPLQIGKFYKVDYKTKFLQYTLNRVNEVFGDQAISASTSTDFEPVYELKGLIRPITIEQIASNQIKVAMHKDVYSSVSLDTGGSYKTISTSTNEEKPAISIVGGQSSVSGNDRTVTLEVELAEGSYALMLDDKYPLGQFTFFDTLRKSVTNEGNILYSPPFDRNMVRKVGEKVSLTATQSLQSQTQNGNLGQEWIVRKGNGIITSAQYAQKGITTTANGIDFKPTEAGEYRIQYFLQREYSRTIKRGGALFDWVIPDKRKEGVNAVDNVEWVIKVISDNTVELKFQGEIDVIKTQAGNDYETALKNRKLIEAQNAPDADTTVKRDVLKTDAQKAINAAIALLENDAIALITKYKAADLGESHPKLITEKSLVEGQLVLYKNEKATIDGINTADPAITYRTSFDVGNLVFEPVDAKMSTILTAGRIELKLNTLPAGVTDSASVFSTVDIKWLYKKKSPIDTSTIKEGTSTVFEFTPVAEATLLLEIRERSTTRKDVIFTKSWDVEGTIKPKIAVENPNRADGKHRKNDKITLKVVPSSDLLDEAKYAALFDSYVWTITPPSGTASTPTTSTNTHPLTLAEQGDYRVSVVLKSTAYTQYNGLSADELIIKVEETTTPEGRQQQIDAAKRNADEGKRLVDTSVNPDGTVNTVMREKGKALIEKAIQDLKVVNEYLDAQLKATVTTDSQYRTLELNKQNVETEIKALEDYLTKLKSVSGALFFIRPTEKEFVKGSAIEFALGRVTSGDLFTWTNNNQAAFTTFPSSGASISTRLKDDFTGTVTVTATQIKSDGQPLTDSTSGSVIKADLQLNIVEKEIASLKVSPNQINLELGQQHEFSVTTDIPNVAPAFEVREGDPNYIESVTPANGKITVKLKPAASISAGTPTTGKILIDVYSPNSGGRDVKDTIRIDIVSQNTKFEVLSPPTEIVITNAKNPVQLNVKPTIPQDGITWTVTDAASTNNKGYVDNQNVLHLQDIIVNDVIIVKGVIRDAVKSQISAANFEISFSFSLSIKDDASASTLEVTPNAVEVIIPDAETAATPVILSATYDPKYKIAWSIKETDAKISLVVQLNDAEMGVIAKLIDPSDTTSTYTIVATAGPHTKEIPVKRITAGSTLISLGSATMQLKAAPVKKTITTTTTEQTITYYEGTGTDDKVYLKLDGSWNELPTGVTQQLFINMYYLKKAKNIK